MRSFFFYFNFFLDCILTFPCFLFPYQLQNVNGQNVLTQVQTPMQVQGAPGLVFQRNTAGGAPKLTTAQFISSPTSPAQFIIPTSSTGGTQFLIPTSSSQGLALDSFPYFQLYIFVLLTVKVKTWFVQVPNS